MKKAFLSHLFCLCIFLASCLPITAWEPPKGEDSGKDTGSVVEVFDADGDGFNKESGDCNDDDSTIYPGAPEVCNYLDDNCNGSVDEGVKIIFYADQDDDSFGNALSSTEACSVPEGYVADATDCDDWNAAINPGASESCNNLDDNCNEEIDEGVKVTFYADDDVDGYGDVAKTIEDCSVPDGYVVDATDCDDSNASIHPDAVEIVADGLDQDCDAGDTCYLDEDIDSYGGVTLTDSFDLDCFDSGESSVNTDCDDSRRSVYPGAPEDDCEDTVDYNCDGSASLDDRDSDGFVACNDCNDTDDLINPDAAEICDEIDNDCDTLIDDADSSTVGKSTWYLDSDSDSYGSEIIAMACDMPSGYVAAAGDCDDSDADINPSATEYCDHVDNNCDSVVDEATASGAPTWYADADADGFGDAFEALVACEAPEAYVVDATDCDDSNSAINPAGTEICDDLDNDCDDVVDDADSSTVGKSTWYLDSDSDSYGSEIIAMACDMPSGYVAVAGDCDDSDVDISPDATEYCDHVDNNCDGVVDEVTASGAPTWYADADADGFGDASEALVDCEAPEAYIADATDCDDSNASINPAASETCNDLDDDCDDDIDEGLDVSWYPDSDSDGYGCDANIDVVDCSGPRGFVSNRLDCDDTNAFINPEATETCDDVDEDCDGEVDEGLDIYNWYLDNDDDGFGNASEALVACEAPEAYVADATDCNDSNSDIYPEAPEICDGLDNDCDDIVDDKTESVTWYQDFDTDGFGNEEVFMTSCSIPLGYVTDSTDCDDTDADVNPDATETCDDLDNDCDGDIDEDDAVDARSWFLDSDGDMFGAPDVVEVACYGATGYVNNGLDCDDSEEDINPDATEVTNGVDDDCDGEVDETACEISVWYYDYDGDNYGDASESVEACTAPIGYVSDNTDCDDFDEEINPEADEACNDLDDDCDDSVDEGWNCEDVDVDGILNGEDLINIIDVDSDGYDDACIPGFLVLVAPYSTAAAYLQIDDASYGRPYTSLVESRAMNGDIDSDGVVDSWCISAEEFHTSTETFRFVSTLSAEDSSVFVNPLDCSDWKIPDFSDYCTAFGSCCRFETAWDGCANVGFTPYIRISGSKITCP